MSSSGHDCPGLLDFLMPVPFSNRLWKSGTVRKLMLLRHKKLYIIEPNATRQRAVVNIVLRWKVNKCRYKYLSTHEVCCRIKILFYLYLSLIHISEPTRLGMISYA